MLVCFIYGLISWKFLIRNMCIMLSHELRAVRNEGSCGLMYLSMLYRFIALLQKCCRSYGYGYGCDKSGSF